MAIWKYLDEETMEEFGKKCGVVAAGIFFFSILIYYPILFIYVIIFDFPDHGIAAKIFEGLVGFPFLLFLFMLFLMAITGLMACLGVINVLCFVSGITLLVWGMGSKSILLFCLSVSLIFISPLFCLFNSVYYAIKNAINSRKNK